MTSNKNSHLTRINDLIVRGNITCSKLGVFSNLIVNG